MGKLTLTTVKIGQTALAVEGWLRVLREDVDILCGMVTAGDLTSGEALVLITMLDELEAGIVMLGRELRDKKDRT